MHPRSRTEVGVLLGVANDGSVSVQHDEQNPFIEIKERIHWARERVWIYNAFLCVVLVLIWLLRSLHATRRRRRHLQSTLARAAADDSISDSSSTCPGTATPPDVKRRDNEPNEGIPLLRKSKHQRHGFLQWLSYRIKAFMKYQPQPIPYINKTLPDNGTSLFILAFVVLNCVLCTVNIPLKLSMACVYGDRCANLFSANLPLLYLLAAKNQPLKYLTGYSYEALNIFHRRLGELLCFFALVHCITMFIMYFTLLKPLIPDRGLWDFCVEPLILMGILAFISYEVLYLTSLGTFRQKCYEVFLASHILLQTMGLAFLWFHYFNSKLYVLAAVIIFCVDRLVFRLMTNTATMIAAIDILDDGETVMLSADWAIESHQPLFFGRRSIKNGWEPAAHVFLSIPALSKTATLQAHPFTISSAAPELTADKPYAWLNLLIRAHSGFSRDLLHYAQSHSKVSVRFDGPYGSLEPLHMLENSDHAILVAGGSGIAVAFPLLWALLHDEAKARSEAAAESEVAAKQTRAHRKVTLIWIIHSAAHASWIPEARLDELKAFGLDVRIPPPTATHGRPDISNMMEDIVYAHAHRAYESSTSVLVSGPDALNRDVRNTCSKLVGDGLDVSITVEKFGW